MIDQLRHCRQSDEIERTIFFSLSLILGHQIQISQVTPNDLSLQRNNTVHDIQHGKYN